MLYHYIVCRTDIPIGNVCAQITHAAGESAALFGAELPKNTHAVVLGVASESELLRLESKAKATDLRFCPIREPDPPFNGQLMAVGFVPGSKSHFKSLLSNYALLKSLTVTSLPKEKS